jgi:hypothetical protein
MLPRKPSSLRFRADGFWKKTSPLLHRTDFCIFILRHTFFCLPSAFPVPSECLPSAFRVPSECLPSALAVPSQCPRSALAVPSQSPRRALAVPSQCPRSALAHVIHHIGASSEQNWGSFSSSSTHQCRDGFSFSVF